MQNLNIVFEDADFIVLNKPSGLLVHPARTSDELTLADMLKAYHPPIAEVGEDPLRPGIVHRLDRDASGLMVAAKNNNAFFYLKKLFQERKLIKKYYALVYGILKDKSGIIDLPIGRLADKRTTRLSGKKEIAGREAATGYRVLNEIRDTYSLLDISIKTGRTHQIRVHLKAIGHPIVCDALYGRKSDVCPPEIGRLFLHAYFLSFASQSGAQLAFEADLPKELKAFASF